MNRYKKYIGLADKDSTHNVFVEIWDTGGIQHTYFLPLYLGVANHSPTGFAWGYGGSGPSQLALAILMDYFLDRYEFAEAKEEALKHYFNLKQLRIAQLDQNQNFHLSTGIIQGLLSLDPAVPLNERGLGKLGKVN